MTTNPSAKLNVDHEVFPEGTRFFLASGCETQLACLFYGIKEMVKVISQVFESTATSILAGISGIDGKRLINSVTRMFKPYS